MNDGGFSPGATSELQARGYFLIPLPSRRKEPPPEGWVGHAGPYEIPPGSNVAIATRGELAILITNDERSTNWATEEFGQPHVFSRRGAHWYFRAPNGFANERNVETPVGVMELHVRNKYALVPPSVHPTGTAEAPGYRWGRSLPALAELPAFPDLRDLWHPSGTHHAKLLQLSSAKAHAGKTAEEIFTELVKWREDHLPDPRAHTDRELRQLADSAFAKFHVAPAIAAPAPAGTEGARHELWSRTANRRTGEETFSPVHSEFIDALVENAHFATYRLSKDRGDLLVYDPTSGAYRTGGETTVREYLRTNFRQKKLSPSRNDDATIIMGVRAQTYREVSEFNPKGRICVANGVLNLETMRLEPHSPEVLFTSALPVAYEPGATCPEFLRWLEQMQPDPVVRGLVQEICGYLFTDGQPFKVAFLFYGETDTGKSTMLRVIISMIGPDGIATESLQRLADEKFATAALYGKRANIHADIPNRSIHGAGNFLMLTGGDLIPAEKKFETQFSFWNSAKLIFSTNVLPPVDNRTAAFFGRWILVTWDVQIPKREQKGEDFAAAMARREGPGILNWMLEGRTRLLKRGHFPGATTTVGDLAEVWRVKSDSLSWFLSQEVEADAAAFVPKFDFDRAYAEFCTRNEVPMKPPSTVGAELPRKIAGVVPSKKRLKPGKKNPQIPCWVGVRLLPPGERRNALRGISEVSKVSDPVLSRSRSRAHVKPVAGPPVTTDTPATPRRVHSNCPHCPGSAHHVCYACEACRWAEAHQEDSP